MRERVRELVGTEDHTQKGKFIPPPQSVLNPGSGNTVPRVKDCGGRKNVPNPGSGNTVPRVGALTSPDTGKPGSRVEEWREPCLLEVNPQTRNELIGPVRPDDFHCLVDTYGPRRHADLSLG